MDICSAELQQTTLAYEEHPSAPEPSEKRTALRIELPWAWD